MRKRAITVSPEASLRRAAIYVRVSTEEQARGGVSLDTQEQACRRYAAMRSLAIATVVHDDGVTSGTPFADRAGGRELTDLIADGAVSDVIGYSLSRLFRNNIEAQVSVNLWRDAGITVHLMDYGGATVDTSSAIGQFIFASMASAAELERNQLRERVRDNMRRIAETGRWPGGRVFGYRHKDKRLVPDPDEAAIVVEVFRRYSRGQSLMQIARWLNAEGVEQRKGGKQWQAGQVWHMLRCPVHIGQFEWGGEVYDGTHEPIVSKRLWNSVQRRMVALGPTGGHAPQSLVSLYRCGLCGGNIQRNAHRGGPYYVCAARAAMPHDQRHDAIYIREAKASAMTWRHSELVIASGDLSEMARLQAERKELARGRGRELRSQLDDVQEQLRRLAQAAAAGLPLDVIEEQAAPLTLERDRLVALLEGSASSVIVPEHVDEERLLTALEVVKERGTAEEQLGFLRVFIDRIAVEKGRLVYHSPGGLLPETPRIAPRRFVAGVTRLEW